MFRGIPVNKCRDNRGARISERDVQYDKCYPLRDHVTRSHSFTRDLRYGALGHFHYTIRSVVQITYGSSDVFCSVISSIFDSLTST